MLDTVKNPVDEVFGRWRTAIEPVVGKGNLSNDESQTIASNKKVYARLFLLGNPTSRGNLEGDECATTPSFQSESYAAGSKASSKASIFPFFIINCSNFASFKSPPHNPI